VNRHAVRHGWPPTRVGAGIENTVELERCDVPRRVAAHLRRDFGGMTLGRGLHGFLAAIGQGGRPVQAPGGDGDIGLQGDVELGAEATTARRRQDTNLRRIQGHDLRHRLPVHVRRLGRGEDLEAIPDAAGKPGFGLDIGVLDERRGKAALRNMDRLSKPGRDIAALDNAAHQHIAFAPGMKPWGVLGPSLGGGQHVRQGRPAHRECVQIEILHRGALAGDGGHGLAAKANHRLGKDRLIGESRNRAETVAPGNIRRREHRQDTGVTLHETGHIAENECRMMMRAAHDVYEDRIVRRQVRPESFGPRHLGIAIQAADTRANTRAGRRKRLADIEAARVHDRIDNLAISGASAEHTAQGIGHLAARWGWVAPEQRGGSDQHARRANAALGRAEMQKRFLQPRQRAVRFQAFDRGDVRTRHLTGRDQTGAAGFAIDQHGASPAIAGIASDLGAHQPQMVAQHQGEPITGRHVGQDSRAVQIERYFAAAHGVGLTPNSLELRA